MNRSETITKLAAALISFNSQVSKIAKDATNPFHKNKYATLDQIIEEVRPILSENKLSIMQNPSVSDGLITVKTLLLHESGEWIESTGTTLKLVKNDPQGAGAGITYARRYDLCAFLSLNTGDDDDGNSASGLSKQNPITPAQIGSIKTKVMELAKLRNQTEQNVYKVLQITDLTKISESDAAKALANLDKWINNAKKETN